MRFTLSSSTLSNRLGQLSKVINSKNSISILDCFLFEIKNGILTLTASDNANMMQLTMDLNECDGEACFCIPNRIILAAVKEVPEQPLTFEYNPDDNSIQLLYQNGCYKIVGLSATEYPRLNDIDGSCSELQLTTVQLSNAIQRTLFATGSEELRVVMNGIYFDLTDSSLNLVASDGYMMVRNMIFTCKSDTPASFILPKKPASLLRGALAGNDEDTVTIRFTNTQAEFEFTGGHLICRLIEGKYPNYMAVIPHNNPNVLSIDRKALTSALRRVLPFASESTQLVKLRLTQNNLELSAEDIDFATSAHEDIAGDYSGTPMNIGFKGSSLMDILNNLTSETVDIELADPSRAGVICPTEQPENENIVMLVMPMLISE